MDSLQTSELTERLTDAGLVDAGSVTVIVL